MIWTLFESLCHPWSLSITFGIQVSGHLRVLSLSLSRSLHSTVRYFCCFLYCPVFTPIACLYILFQLLGMQLTLIFISNACAVEGMHRMNIQDGQGRTHYLSRYYAMWNEPRPESSTIVCFIYLEPLIKKNLWETILVVHNSVLWTKLVLSNILSQDKETAEKLSNFCEKQRLYRELASAAESGWDFSTRWMR